METATKDAADKSTAKLEKELEQKRLKRTQAKENYEAACAAVRTARNELRAAQGLPALKKPGRRKSEEE